MSRSDWSNVKFHVSLVSGLKFTEVCKHHQNRLRRHQNTYTFLKLLAISLRLYSKDEMSQLLSRMMFKSHVTSRIPLLVCYFCGGRERGGGVVQPIGCFCKNKCLGWIIPVQVQFVLTWRVLHVEQEMLSHLISILANVVMLLLDCFLKYAQLKFDLLSPHTWLRGIFKRFGGGFLVLKHLNIDLLRL